MENNNKGFTLIELIISLTIFAVVITAVFGFMLSGVRSYRTVSNRVNIDLETQLTLSQIEEYVIDCNSCISFKNGKLYVINDEDGSYKVNLFEFKSDDCLYFGTGTALKSPLTGEYVCTVTATDLLAEDVNEFYVTPISEDGVSYSSAKITITFSKHSVTRRHEKIIALRNMPIIAEVS